MEKKTTISQEELGKDKTIKGTVKRETVYPETIQTPDYDYGTSQNTLDAELALRNNAGGAKMLVFSRLLTVGTGNQSFTGFGFTPTSYTIMAWKTAFDGNAVFTSGGYDGTTQLAGWLDVGGSNTGTYVLRAKEVTNATAATHVSFDSDGITLNFSTSAIDLQIMITCFS